MNSGMHTWHREIGSIKVDDFLVDKHHKNMITSPYLLRHKTCNLHEMVNNSKTRQKRLSHNFRDSYEHFVRYHSDDSRAQQTVIIGPSIISTIEPRMVIIL